MVFFQERLLAKIDKSKISQILKNYGDFEVLAFKPCSGWQNLSLQVKTSSGEFILRIYRNKNLAKINSTLDLTEYLKEVNFPAQNFLTPKTGGKVIKIEIGKSFYLAVLFEYLKGVTKNFLTEKELAQVGEITGKLHQSLAKFESLTGFRKLNLVNLFYQVKRRFDLVQEAQLLKLWEKFSPEIKKTIQKNREILNQKQLIHGDLAPSNIVFQNGSAGLLDFDEVIVAPKIWDLVNFVGNYTQTLKSWGKSQKILAILKNLEKGYLKFDYLSHPEKILFRQILRLWLLKKILWAKKEAAKKYREKWAKDVMLWSIAALEEKF